MSKAMSEAETEGKSHQDAVRQANDRENHLRLQLEGAVSEIHRLKQEIVSLQQILDQTGHEGVLKVSN